MFASPLPLVCWRHGCKTQQETKQQLISFDYWALILKYNIITFPYIPKAPEPKQWLDPVLRQDFGKMFTDGRLEKESTRPQSARLGSI